MSTPTDNYLRLQETPPAEAPPPAGAIDFFNDPATGNLVRRDSAGTEAIIGGPTEVSDLQYDPAITGLTGGGATKLDGIATVGVAAGRIQAVVVSAMVYFYELRVGVEAERNPTYIRPDDYNGSTNTKIWRLLDFRIQTLSATVGNFEGVNIDQTSLAGASEDTRLNTMPEADGELALATTAQRITPTSGATVSYDRYVDQFMYLTPAGTLATLTLGFPDATDCRDGQSVTLFSTQTITALTVNAGTGSTMGGTALTACVANTTYSFIYVATVTKWVRIA